MSTGENLTPPPIRRLLPAPQVEAATDEQLLQWYRPDAVPAGAPPRVRFNFVSSLDGSATLHGRSGALGSTADQRIFALLRRHADVILVGAQTVRTEGYAGPLLDEAAQQWRRNRGQDVHPVPVVVSGSLQLDPAGPFFTEAPVRPIVVATRNSPRERRREFEPVADLIVCGEHRIDVHALLVELSNRGHRQILCEGGPHLFGSFQQAASVDELCLSLSPLLVAGQNLRIAVTEPAASAPASASQSASAPTSPATTPAAAMSTPTPSAAAIGMSLQHVLCAEDMLFLRYQNRHQISLRANEFA